MKKIKTDPYLASQAFWEKQIRRMALRLRRNPGLLKSTNKNYYEKYNEGSGKEMPLH